MQSLNFFISIRSTGAKTGIGALTRWSAGTSHRRGRAEIPFIKSHSCAKAVGPVPPKAQGFVGPDFVQGTWRKTDNLRSRQQRTQVQPKPGPTSADLRPQRSDHHPPQQQMEPAEEPGPGQHQQQGRPIAFRNWRDRQPDDNAGGGSSPRRLRSPIGARVQGRGGSWYRRSRCRPWRNRYWLQRSKHRPDRRQK